MLLVAILFVNFMCALSQFGDLNPNFANLNSIQEITNQWLKFKSDNFKQFSPEEDTRRFNIFKENLKRIDDYRQKLQAGLIDFRVAITQFADLTKEEFISKMLTLKVPEERSKRALPKLNRTIRQISDSVDWRNQGAVTPIKNQKDCSSCWAFSAVGSLEGQYYKKYGNLISISEQNLIDCSTDGNNRGCNGGWIGNAFKYLTNNQITAENEYAYTGTQQMCNNNMGNFKISIKGYQTIQPDESQLQQAVATIGPISAALDASNLQFYAGGVYRDDDCAVGRVNHGIVIVGYGTESGRDYWLIKNSWGNQWGEGGYFKLIRNKGNQCNIASYGMYPNL
ncbi:unnamed protein product [Ceutorhynchus assimilis]|uniref:Uncharacterized protein n=1 Tax=Ceutorhynchus assimilis TaxID=467358 RepID=A0A9N9MIB5_9CUCU|nr:unnamed protein product [Ceutorhynchus assimilis]